MPAKEDKTGSRELLRLGEFADGCYRIFDWFLAGLKKRVYNGTRNPKALAYGLRHSAREFVSSEINMRVPKNFLLAYDQLVGARFSKNKRLNRNAPIPTSELPIKMAPLH